MQHVQHDIRLSLQRAFIGLACGVAAMLDKTAPAQE